MHSISAILIKPFTKLLIKAGAKLICISLLFITQTAHADFRKALDAYQARDGATMLKEVKDAVDKKNDDGLVLFLSVLELDSTLKNSRMFIFSGEHEAREQITNATKENKTVPAPWQSILSAKQTDELNSLLEKATKQSSLESQYRLLSLQYSDGYTIYFTKKQEQLLSELKKLGEQGYLNVYPYLVDIEKSEPEKLLTYKKGVELGQTKLILLNATDYLLGNKNY